MKLQTEHYLLGAFVLIGGIYFYKQHLDNVAQQKAYNTPPASPVTGNAGADGYYSNSSGEGIAAGTTAQLVPKILDGSQVPPMFFAPGFSGAIAYADGYNAAFRKYYKPSVSGNQTQRPQAQATRFR